MLAAVNRDGVDDDAEQQAEHQHDERHGRRVGVEEALDALEEGETLFVERGDRRRRAGQDLFELLRRGAASWTLRSSLPRSFPASPACLFEIGAAGMSPTGAVFVFRRLSSEARRNQPQQSFMPSSDVIEGTPGTGWSVTSFSPVSMLVGFLPVLMYSAIACDAVRRHQQRILLGGCADDAFLDPLHALAAAVDGDEQ